ncbi:hypothetical protein B0J12DRAFT_328788 [Macrophomina phaseolina]|uniref:Uncharacterized protein n=1 Tax=Macrophomina phaseolina TaxID=35725 RepID=A0ABQ8FV07_9PEZI|nr:hypothetical protein B0J12DRAFT_328788 [Macrophomina phaseolina]
MISRAASWHQCHVNRSINNNDSTTIMARRKTGGREEGSSDASLQLRAIVVFCKVFLTDWTAVKISQKIGISEASITRIWKQTLHAAGEGEGCRDLHHLLDHCHAGVRTGRPPRVQPGSKESKQIRESMRNNYTFPREMAAHQVPIKGPPLARRQVENIAKDKRHWEEDLDCPHELVRRKRPKKKCYGAASTVEMRKVGKEGNREGLGRESHHVISST